MTEINEIIYHLKQSNKKEIYIYGSLVVIIKKKVLKAKFFKYIWFSKENKRVKISNTKTFLKTNFLKML